MQLKSTKCLIKFAINCITNPLFCQISRNLVLIGISNLDPRVLVVCVTTVTSARSSTRAGMLITRQGLTLATIPRSTSQTSPRFCFDIRRLHFVMFNKQGIRNFRECLICQRRDIQQSYLLYNFRGDRVFFNLRKLVKCFQYVF